MISSVRAGSAGSKYTTAGCLMAARAGSLTLPMLAHSRRFARTRARAATGKAVVEHLRAAPLRVGAAPPDGGAAAGQGAPCE